MAPKQPRLAVILAADAIDQLDEIWRWDANRYNPDHATNYGIFLKKTIDALDRNYAKGKRFGRRPDLRYIQIRRRTGGFAHRAVYSVDENIVNVLHVFHSAEDWENKLAEE
jgi:plasmid stabilization system protein ParE